MNLHLIATAMLSSPCLMQGAFILVGNNSFGYPLLVVMAIGVFTYAAWRLWEGITGQGSDDAFGPFKNFFRYRLSPLVSVSEQLQGQWQLNFYLHLCACFAKYSAALSCLRSCISHARSTEQIDGFKTLHSQQPCTPHVPLMHNYSECAESLEMCCLACRARYTRPTASLWSP